MTIRPPRWKKHSLRYADLVKQGKVRSIGCSNFTAARIEESLKASREHGYPEYVSLQPNYNLYDREDYEKNLEPTVMKHKLGVISYFSLASGFLTGKYRSKAEAEGVARSGMVTKYFTDRGSRILQALNKVARAKNATQAQVALGMADGASEHYGTDRQRDQDRATERNYCRDEVKTR